MTATRTPVHPVYLAALAERERHPDRSVYVRIADTARLIRAELARRWPDVTWYVRSKSYAGGGSIDVYYDAALIGADGQSLWILTDYNDRPYEWSEPVEYSAVDYARGRWAHAIRADRPAPSAVRDALAGYGSARFDGMTDLGYHVSSWLNPDGSATLGDSHGANGTDPAWSYSRTDPGAVLVSFGAGYVFVNDETPYDVRQKRAS